MDASLFQDDASFEKQYREQEERIEIDAPAGKLGVVIDTPVGGVPLVHAIKDTSILADQVRVGDQLVSVDDVDTTQLSAIEVSKLISSRANNPSRILVFIRLSGGDR
jgi:C-terminal processing protease CtpA/Prc